MGPRLSSVPSVKNGELLGLLVPSVGDFGKTHFAKSRSGALMGLRTAQVAGVSVQFHPVHLATDGTRLTNTGRRIGQKLIWASLVLELVPLFWFVFKGKPAGTLLSHLDGHTHLFVFKKHYSKSMFLVSNCMKSRNSGPKGIPPGDLYFCGGSTFFPQGLTQPQPRLCCPSCLSGHFWGFRHERILPENAVLRLDPDSWTKS